MLGGQGAGLAQILCLALGAMRPRWEAADLASITVFWMIVPRWRSWNGRAVLRFVSEMSDPAKTVPPDEGLPYESEWRDELDRRRETPDSEWIKGSIADRAWARFLKKKYG